MQQRKSFAELDHPLTSATALISFVVAHLHKIGGLELPYAFEAAEKIPVTWLPNLLTEYEADVPLDGSPEQTASTTQRS